MVPPIGGTVATGRVCILDIVLLMGGMVTIGGVREITGDRTDVSWGFGGALTSPVCTRAGVDILCELLCDCAETATISFFRQLGSLCDDTTECPSPSGAEKEGRLTILVKLCCPDDMTVPS